MTPQRFMIIAGEPSGDLLAAELVGQLRAAIAKRSTYTRDLQPLNSDLAPQFFGAGGPRMAEAGVKLAFDLTRHSVTGLADVLKNYSKFKRLFNELLAVAIEREPHVIICVDFSGFNSRFAAAVKKHVRKHRGPFNNWNPKIIKYISPQVWASRPGRAYAVAQDFDLLLSVIPFEKEWYAKRVPRLPVEFIGHPIIDRHAGAKSLGRIARNENAPLILLLPGSRAGELKRHLPPMLGAWEKIKAAIPGANTRVILPDAVMAALVKTLPGANVAGLEIQVGGLAESLKQADLAIASTGTITMECAYFGVPTVTLYQAAGLALGFKLGIIHIKWLTMPNILANREIFPEFLQGNATAENLSQAALELLRDPARRADVQRELASIIASLGEPGASRRAAEAILKIDHRFSVKSVIGLSL